MRAAFAKGATPVGGCAPHVARWVAGWGGAAARVCTVSAAPHALPLAQGQNTHHSHHVHAPPATDSSVIVDSSSEVSVLS